MTTPKSTIESPKKSNRARNQSSSPTIGQLISSQRLTAAQEIIVVNRYALTVSKGGAKPRNSFR